MASLLTGSDQLLVANSDAYQWLVSEIIARAGRSPPEETLRRIEVAAHFAAMSHTGRFADGAIENLALNIGREIAPRGEAATARSKPAADSAGRRRVLHYMDRAVAVGGHTRMLRHWVNEDRSSCHSLVLAFQGDLAVPEKVQRAISGSGGTILVLPESQSRLERASFLRSVALGGADIVVLHHNAWDVVPTLAFATAGLPPVAVLNHADHLFWLGSSIADVVINLRSSSVAHTRERRFIDCNTVLPVPLVDESRVADRQSARRALGIGADDIALLSVGRSEKYRPCEKHDFVATARRILERRTSAHIYVVGESEEGILRHVEGPLHPRMHFVGEVEDPSSYRAAADIYLESFPFGSQTALLEAALSGLPAVAAAAPLSPLLVANDDALSDMLSNPVDQDEYIARALELIDRPAFRAGEGAQLRRKLLARNVGVGWLQRLDQVYRLTDRLVHRPQPIPIGERCSEPGDLGLCLWQVISGRTAPPAASRNGLDLAIAHAAFARQRVGDYRTLRRKSLQRLLIAPHLPSSWHLAAFALRSHVGAGLRWTKDMRRRLLRLPALP